MLPVEAGRPAHTDVVQSTLPTLTRQRRRRWGGSGQRMRACTGAHGVSALQAGTGAHAVDALQANTKAHAVDAAMHSAADPHVRTHPAGAGACPQVAPRCDRHGVCVTDAVGDEGDARLGTGALSQRPAADAAFFVGCKAADGERRGGNAWRRGQLNREALSGVGGQGNM
eukprot:362534-Chlamydomonas_euryale.AAC.9